MRYSLKVALARLLNKTNYCMNDPFIKRAPTTSRQSALDSITSDVPMARTCHGTPKASLPNMRCLALSVPEIGGVRNLKKVGHVTMRTPH